MLNDARVASLGFFKDNICTTRINKEKKFKMKFQVLLKFAQILPDYTPFIPLLELSLSICLLIQFPLTGLKCQTERGVLFKRFFEKKNFNFYYLLELSFFSIFLATLTRNVKAS